MVNISKQVEHWRRGSDEDWQVAVELVGNGRVRHGLFFAHLAIEKALKAAFCHATNELAPPIHNLVRLAENAGIPLAMPQRDLLAEVNSFNIEGRYPELLVPVPTSEEAEDYLCRLGELRAWLNNQF